jgi:hypothetical protein
MRRGSLELEEGAAAMDNSWLSVVARAAHRGAGRGARVEGCPRVVNGDGARAGPDRRANGRGRSTVQWTHGVRRRSAAGTDAGGAVGPLRGRRGRRTRPVAASRPAEPHMNSPCHRANVGRASRQDAGADVEMSDRRGSWRQDAARRAGASSGDHPQHVAQKAGRRDVRTRTASCRLFVICFARSLAFGLCCDAASCRSTPAVQGPYVGAGILPARPRDARAWERAIHMRACGPVVL